jgi:hypothetical protein
MQKTFAKIFGAIFLLIGILGFFNNPIIGPVGILRTGVIDNSIHIVLGIVLLFSGSMARLLIRGIGFLLLVFSVVGFLVPGALELFGGLLRMNNALDITGLIVGLLFVGFSFLGQENDGMYLRR